MIRLAKPGFCIALALAFLLAGRDGVRALEPSGTFAAIFDIHFNPLHQPGPGAALLATDTRDWPSSFAAFPGPMSHHGEDTNYPLLASALAAIADKAAQVDFAIIGGDLLAHRFEHKAAEALSASERSASVRVLAQRTSIFVVDALADAMPDKPIFLALGNNDSDCGDYEIEPGGGYLAATRETVRRLAGPERLTDDFDQTYGAGGYYAARHPTQAGTLILVLNDVLWSAKYRDACGGEGEAAGQAMLTWFADRLAQAKAAGGKVWLVHHIPWGIDPYATLHARADTCPASVVPFLNDAFAAEFVALLRTYADTIVLSLSGHIHFDSYRLLVDAQGQAVAVDKIGPGISPIFGQNPGFEVFSYDPGTGLPTDIATYYIANLPETSSSTAAGDWRLEYTFREAYAQKSFSPAAVESIWNALPGMGATTDTFRRLYNVSRGALDADTLPAYLCAIGYLDPQAFTSCYCGN